MNAPLSTTGTAVAAHGLYKRFRTGRTHIEVLKRVDFDALHGDVTMVMGPSGSGKSTLVATLSGLLKPDAAIYYLALDRFRLRPDEALFVDDRQINVTGAELVGMKAHLFTGAADLRARLVAEGLL